MDLTLDRRSLLAGGSIAAAGLTLPSWAVAAPQSAMTPERALTSYRRILCGSPGEEVLWWFIGDLYLQAPGKSVVPVARSLTIGCYTAGQAGPRSFHYNFREAGVMVDLATGEPLSQNPLTKAPVKVPLVDEEPHPIDWTIQDDGNILKTEHGKSSMLDLRWTETSDNLLLLETLPGKDAFALAPADSGSDWKALQSTRTVYVKRASLARPGFVPAEMIYHVAVKATPPWTDDGTPGEKWLIVRGIGQKSRANEVVNRDALTMIRRFFPKYL